MDITSDGPMPRNISNKKKKNLYSLKLKLLTNKFNKKTKSKSIILDELKQASDKLKLIEKNQFNI